MIMHRGTWYDRRSTMAIVTTRMTSKGRVEIPERIRRKMGLMNGSEFVVIEGRGTIILKAVSEPAGNEFTDLLSRVRRQARKTGLRKSDVRAAIRRIRGKTR
jgi:AbrB family looped-hinge helix DNA binding protein